MSTLKGKMHINRSKLNRSKLNRSKRSISNHDTINHGTSESSPKPKSLPSYQQVIEFIDQEKKYGVNPSIKRELGDYDIVPEFKQMLEPDIKQRHAQVEHVELTLANADDYTETTKDVNDSDDDDCQSSKPPCSCSSRKPSKPRFRSDINMTNPKVPRTGSSYKKLPSSQANSGPSKFNKSQYKQIDTNRHLVSQYNFYFKVVRLVIVVNFLYLFIF